MEWIKKQERILERQYKNSSQRLEAGMQGIGNLLMTPNKGYMALNVYMTPEPDPINSIFLHSPHEIKETLGHKWESLSPIKIVSRLRDLLI
jgi:hypothetical protein